MEEQQKQKTFLTTDIVTDYSAYIRTAKCSSLTDVNSIISSVQFIQLYTYSILTVTFATITSTH
jgi:hypothetical protein